MVIFAQMLLGLWLGLFGPPATVGEVGHHGEYSSSTGYDWDNAGGENGARGYDWDNLSSPE